MTNQQRFGAEEKTMTREAYKAAALAAGDGSIGLAEFAALTEKHRRRWAAGVERKFRDSYRLSLPAWYDGDDLAQDIALEIVRYWDKYDRDRGVGLAGYLGWSVDKKIQKTLSKVLGQNQHTHRGAPRPEKPACAFADDVLRVREPHVEPDQERAVAEEEALALARARAKKHAPIFDLLERCGWELDEAAAALYRCPSARARHGVSNKRQARRVVRDAALAIASAMKEAA